MWLSDRSRLYVCMSVRVRVQDVFLVDTNKFCFVWIGGGASPAEKKSGLGYAHVSSLMLIRLNSRIISSPPSVCCEKVLCEGNPS